MYHRYTDLEKQLVLQRLVANSLDVRLTSLQTGVSERTLFMWRGKYLSSLPLQSLQSSQGESSLTTSFQIPQLPANESQALRDIQRQLIDKINHQ